MIRAALAGACLLLAGCAETLDRAPAAAAPGKGCAPEGPFSFICGVQRPEDIVAIPGTPWLVASGFAPGAGLKLIDGETRQARRWWADGAARPDLTAFAGCPGPPDPALLTPRGLALREKAGGGWRLLAVNHGGREAVELFDVTFAEAGEPPSIEWRGCLPMPGGHVGNSVTAFADGTVLTTVLTRPGTTIGDFMLGKVTGGVWQWRPGEASFTFLQGTGLPGNNGIETDRDERHFYVVAFGLHGVAMYDRQDTARPVRFFEAADFMPDNIRWTGGRLLLTGMRLDEPACGGLRKVVDGVADPMLCHRGWVVGELDRQLGRIATFAYGGPQPGFNGHSAAALRGSELWLGSFQSDRVAIVEKSGSEEF